jgi:hypothetical protein
MEVPICGYSAHTHAHDLNTRAIDHWPPLQRVVMATDLHCYKRMLSWRSCRCRGLSEESMAVLPVACDLD